MSADMRTDTHPCPWCHEPTDEDGSLFACMIAHCLDCLAVCRPCQADMKSEASL